MTHPIGKKMGSVFIPVKDLQNSAEFYSMVFDLPLKKVSPPVYNLELENITVTLDVDDFEKPYRDGEVQPSVHGLFYLSAPDIQKAYDYFIAHNVEVTPMERFGSASLFHFYDPDRNKIMIYGNP